MSVGNYQYGQGYSAASENGELSHLHYLTRHRNDNATVWSDCGERGRPTDNGRVRISAYEVHAGKQTTSWEDTESGS